MRFLEILVLLHLLVILFILFRRITIRRYLILASVSLLIITLVHLVFETYRWQMVPAYFYALILFFILLLTAFTKKYERKGRLKSRFRRAIQVVGIAFSVLLILLVAVPPALFPVFKLPEPTGPYEVGSSTLFYTDYSRIVQHSEAEKNRELSLRIWYPAEPSLKQNPMPYMQALEARSLAELYNMPSFLLDHFRLVKTASYADANPREGNYPLLLYSPSGDMVQNTVLFQELASHGYIVVSVGHPYWNAFYYNSEGQVIPFSNEDPYYMSMWEEEYSDSVNIIKERITSAKILDIKRDEQQKLNHHMPLEIADIRLWAEDLSFLLDELEKSHDSGAGLMQYIDLNSIGVLGFSKGGAAAGQFCVSDERCRAGVNLSGFMFGDALEKRIRVPFMFMENMEDWCLDCNPISEVFYEDALADAYMVRIVGARHGNFSDWSLVGAYLKIMGMIGTINGRRSLEIQALYIRTFFDSYLKGKNSDLIQGLWSSYPEVKFESSLYP